MCTEYRRSKFRWMSSSMQVNRMKWVLLRSKSSDLWNYSGTGNNNLKFTKLRYPIYNSPRINEYGCITDMLILSMLGHNCHVYISICKSEMYPNYYLFLFLKSCPPPLCFYSLKNNFIKNLYGKKFIYSFCNVNDKIQLSTKGFIGIPSIYFYIKKCVFPIDNIAIFIN